MTGKVIVIGAAAGESSITTQADLSPAGEHAYLRHLDGRVYVCPWRLQLRAWHDLDEFRP